MTEIITAQAPHGAQVPEQDRVGTCLGPYRITRCLGHGGMGQVYEAIHQEIGQRVAIKVLASRLAQRETFRARFLTEARAGALVLHPSLLRILDHGALPDGTPYILMDFLQGQTLRAYLQDLAHKRGPLLEGLRYVRQVAAGLAAAHAAGIVHQDVKPENIMLVADPEAPGGQRAIVLDFGVARFVESLPPSQSPLLPSFGTPLYMAPERCRGDLDLDGRSDVYSLGIVLFELLVGRPPFLGHPAQSQHLINQHLFADPPKASSLCPGLPKGVDDVLAQLLHKDLAHRPGMADTERLLTQLVAALQQATQPGPRVALLPSMRLVFVLVLVLVLLLKPSPEPPRGMTFVPGATFLMGSTPAELDEAKLWTTENLNCKDCPPAIFPRETPDHLVHVPGYFLDTTETSAGDYATYVASQPAAARDVRWMKGVGGHWVNADTRQSAPAESALILSLDGVAVAELRPTQGSTLVTSPLIAVADHVEVLPGHERQPVTNVTWFGAKLYCEAQGKRLPTEAEWELAARGPERRRFPWGDHPNGCGQAFPTAWRSPCVTGGMAPADIGTTATDKTPLGIADLGGNVAEWVLDAFRKRYQACQAVCVAPIVHYDSSDPEERGLRVVRGGSYSLSADSTRAASRSRWWADSAAGDIGFRCARDVAPEEIGK